MYKLLCISLLCNMQVAVAKMN